MEIKLIQFGEERLKNSKEQASPVVRQSHESAGFVGRGWGREERTADQPAIYICNGLKN